MCRGRSGILFFGGSVSVSSIVAFRQFIQRSPPIPFSFHFIIWGTSQHFHPIPFPSFFSSNPSPSQYQPCPLLPQTIIPASPPIHPSIPHRVHKINKNKSGRGERLTLQTLLIIQQLSKMNQPNTRRTRRLPLPLLPPLPQNQFLELIHRNTKGVRLVCFADRNRLGDLDASFGKILLVDLVRVSGACGE